VKALAPSLLLFVCEKVLFSLLSGTNRPISVFWAGLPGSQVTFFSPGPAAKVGSHNL